MNKIARPLLTSFAVLGTGLAMIGVLMFAFVQQVEAHKAGAHESGVTLEVAIRDNGQTVVRGAEVTSVSGDTIYARTEWGASALAWTISTNGDTDFVEKDGSGSSLGDISVGDYVSFSGVLDDNATAFTVDANVVKNWSLDEGDDSDIKDHAEVKVKTNWGDWMKRMSEFKWFGGKDDHR